MLESAVVKNFQKHRKLKIEFDPRVTTVVGSTEAGKSTFLRALLFAFYSRWKPAYHRHGTADTSVKVKLDGKTIVRRKGKGVNSFTIDGKKLAAVGKGGVPEEVQRLLALAPANVQSQLDPPFWFTETPGAISKKLNRVVNLELIDETLARAAAGCRQAEADLKAAVALDAQAQEELRKTAWTVKAVKLGGRAADLGQKARKAAQARRRLEIPTSKARDTRKVGIRLQRTFLAGCSAVAAGEAARAAAVDRERLACLIKKLEELEADAALELPDFDPVLKLRKAGDLAAEERRHLEGMCRDARAAAKELLLVKMELVAAADALQAAAKKRGNQRCPKCGQPIGSSPPPSATSTPATTARGAGRNRTSTRSCADSSGHSSPF
jgi:uncharacterized protein YhaN